MADKYNSGMQGQTKIKGSLGDNNNIKQSVKNTVTNNTQINHRDSHDTTNHIGIDSHDTTNYHLETHDRHDSTHYISNSYTSLTDSHDSYDSHDQYYVDNSRTSYDSHNITNNVQHIQASFTSTGQAIAFGAFFGNGTLVKFGVVLAGLAGIAAVVFADYVIMIGAASAVAGLIGTVGYQGAKFLIRNRASQHASFIQAQLAMLERQEVLEQREHESRLAELSRPLSITVNTKEDLRSILGNSPKMIEDRSSNIIPIPAQKQKELVRRRTK